MTCDASRLFCRSVSGRAVSPVSRLQSGRARRFSRRQRYAVPGKAIGGQSFSAIRIDQCGRFSLLPRILAVVTAIPPENPRTVANVRSSISNVSRRFPTRRCSTFCRVLSSDSQCASRNLFRVRTQADSLSMFESSIFPCGLPGAPLGRKYVDGVRSPNEMKSREAYPSQTCVTT